MLIRRKMTKWTNHVGFEIDAAEVLGLRLIITDEGDHDGVDGLYGANLDFGDAVGSPHVPFRPSVATPQPHLDLSRLHACTTPSRYIPPCIKTLHSRKWIKRKNHLHVDMDVCVDKKKKKMTMMMHVLPLGPILHWRAHNHLPQIKR